MLIAVLAWLGYTWVRDNTEWLPQRETVVAYISGSDRERQIAQALDRNDQVAVEMLIAMRQEPITKLEEAKQALQEQGEDLKNAEEALRLALLVNGGEPERPEEFPLAEQVAANGRRLKQVLELEQVLNRRITRDKTIY